MEVKNTFLPRPEKWLIIIFLLGFYMNPEHKFHLFVTIVTVIFMFYAIDFVVPRLTFSPELNQYIKPVVIIFSTVGVYKILATLVLGLAKHWNWVNRWLLGAHYLGGLGSEASSLLVGR